MKCSNCRFVGKVIGLALLIGLWGCFEHKSRFDDSDSIDFNGFDSLYGDTNMSATYKGEDRFHWQRPDIVIELMGDISDKTVVDLGAGSGYFAFRLVKKAQKVIAIDIDTNMIALLEEEKGYYPTEIQQRIETRLAEPNDPKLRSQEADIVLIVNTYTFINDRVAYFQKLRDKLKPGGMVIIVDFKKRNLPIGPSKEHKVPILLVEDELQAAGFKSIESDDLTLAYQYIIKAYN
jgi:ubiquinone/menaquinone biosynthesis C-methylase UbiE